MPEITDEEYQQLTAARDQLPTLQQELEQVKGQTQTLQQQLEAKHTEATQAKTSYGLIEQQYMQEKQKAEGLETQVNQLKPQAEKAATLQQQLTANRKSQLIARGMKEEDVANLSEDELATAEKLIGKMPMAGTVRYETGGQSSSNTSHLTPHEKIRQGIDSEMDRFTAAKKTG